LTCYGYTDKQEGEPLTIVFGTQYNIITRGVHE